MDLYTIDEYVYRGEWDTVQFVTDAPWDVVMNCCVALDLPNRTSCDDLDYALTNLGYTFEKQSPEWGHIIGRSEVSDHEDFLRDNRPDIYELIENDNYNGET